MVAKSRLKLYTSEAAQDKDRKVLGVGAAYNNVDLELLGDLNRLSPDEGLEQLYVPDVSVVETDEIEAIFPGSTPIFQTPVFGDWRDGVLQLICQGCAARSEIRQRFLPGGVL